MKIVSSAKEQDNGEHFYLKAVSCMYFWLIVRGSFNGV